MLQCRRQHAPTRAATTAALQGRTSPAAQHTDDTFCDIRSAISTETRRIVASKHIKTVRSLQIIQYRVPAKSNSTRSVTTTCTPPRRWLQHAIPRLHQGPAHDSPRLLARCIQVLRRSVTSRSNCARDRVIKPPPWADSGSV